MLAQLAVGGGVSQLGKTKPPSSSSSVSSSSSSARKRGGFQTFVRENNKQKLRGLLEEEDVAVAAAVGEDSMMMMSSSSLPKATAIDMILNQKSKKKMKENFVVGKTDGKDFNCGASNASSGGSSNSSSTGAGRMRRRRGELMRNRRKKDFLEAMQGLTFLGKATAMSKRDDDDDDFNNVNADENHLFHQYHQSAPMMKSNAKEVIAILQPIPKTAATTTAFPDQNRQLKRRDLNLKKDVGEEVKGVAAVGGGGEEGKDGQRNEIFSSSSSFPAPISSRNDNISVKSLPVENSTAPSENDRDNNVNCLRQSSSSLSLHRETSVMSDNNNSSLADDWSVCAVPLEGGGGGGGGGSVRGGNDAASTRSSWLDVGEDEVLSVASNDWN